jgi:4-hydroxybenzoate polyprenyltransferase
VNSRLRALRVVHPFPSLLNSALVLALALVARGVPATAAVLAIGMLGLQLCIGATNDLLDADLDAQAKPWKPIPSGLISAPTVRLVALVAAGIGLLAAAVGGPVIVLLWAAMLACGLVYDFLLKPTPWAWACFSVAFALLPIYAWDGAVGAMPPLPEFLIPLAVIAGPAVQLANGLVDLEVDAAGGLRTLAARLGRTRTLVLIATLLLVIHGLAWATLVRSSAQVNLLVAAGSLTALAGFVLSTRRSVMAREAGWSLQAGSICLLGVGWLSAVA